MDNIFKNNSNHILGLNSFAGQKDINKRAKEIINRLKIDDVPCFDLDIDMFDNFRDEITVKESQQKLSTPKNKLKEFFFWFQITDSIDETALIKIQNKEYQQAINLWGNGFTNDYQNFIYIKNLVILQCLLLLKDNYKGNYHKICKESIALWKTIVDSEKFWGAFIKIYNLCDDLNTSNEVIKEFKKQVLFNVADIYAEISIIKNDNYCISEFYKKFKLKSKKFENEIIEPIYKTINSLITQIETIKTDKTSNLREEYKKLKQLLILVQDELNKLIDLNLYEDTETILLRDKIVSVIRHISIEVHNNFDDIDKALDLNKIAVDICGSMTLKAELQQDTKKFEDNLKKENDNPYSKCWFCGKKYPEETAFLKQPMYRVTERLYNQVKYKKCELLIPRCENCKAIHKIHYFKFFILSGVFVIIIWFLILLYNYYVNGINANLVLQDDSIFGSILFLVCGGVGGFIGRFIRINDVKQENYKGKFPLIKKMLKEGWSCGNGPS